MLLRRPGWARVLLGALARVLWYLFGVPCAWSLPRGAEREGARWGTSGDEEEDEARRLDDDGDGSSPRASHASRVDTLRRAFALAGAADVRHVAGAFDEHLADVSRVLASWDVPEHVALAGYGHTLYGSELFPYALGSFSRAARAEVRAAVGRDAEELMFLYGTCSQKRWYRSVLEIVLPDDVASNGSRTGNAEFVVPEQVNAYTGESRGLTKTLFAFLCAMHAADIISTLPEGRGKRLGETTSVCKSEKKKKPKKKKAQVSAEVFCLRLLRVAAAATRSDPDATKRFPDLERALLFAAGDWATDTGSDVCIEKTTLEGLRRCASDAWLVARATGLA
jgi:hypothetical protein